MIYLKPILGYDRYYVSPCGEVYSTYCHRFLKHSINNWGYHRVELNQKPVCVHRLVAEAYLDNPYDLPQVNHVDEDKDNNHVDNLSFCDMQENNAHTHAKLWYFRDPEGVCMCIRNLAAFCRLHNLHRPSMTRVAFGERRQYKGWSRWER